jgi:hypothetical protein
MLRDNCLSLTLDAVSRENLSLLSSDRHFKSNSRVPVEAVPTF